MEESRMLRIGTIHDYFATLYEFLIVQEKKKRDKDIKISAINSSNYEQSDVSSPVCCKKCQLIILKFKQKTRQMKKKAQRMKKNIFDYDETETHLKEVQDKHECKISSLLKIVEENKIISMPILLLHRNYLIYLLQGRRIRSGCFRNLKIFHLKELYETEVTRLKEHKTQETTGDVVLVASLPQTKQLLLYYLQKTRALFPKYETDNDNQWAFVSESGDQLSSTTCSRIISRFTKGITANQTRHYTSTRIMHDQRFLNCRKLAIEQLLNHSARTSRTYYMAGLNKSKFGSKWVHDNVLPL
jgi:hypothetical protein